MSTALGAGVWRIVVPVPARAMAAVSDALADVADSVAWPEPEAGDGPNTTVLIEAFAARSPTPGLLDEALRDAAARAGVAPPPAHVVFIPARDWLAENRRAFPPVAAGRFLVRGTHVTAPPPAGAVVITLDAATAFGSGTHGSTRGCLLALDRIGRLDRTRRKPSAARGLDLGCGSGILAIAMASGLGLKVVASDVDPESVRVTAANAVANRMGRRVLAVVADGLDAPLLRRRAPYSVVCANILAKPLIALAPAVRRVVADGGWLVLSGLLAADESKIIRAYRGRGFGLRWRIRLDGWSTLAIKRDPSSKGAKASAALAAGV